jgi:ATP-dependent RNA helicase DDX23/PRP28
VLRAIARLNLYVCRSRGAAEKPVDEMTERDWRIFKEDFNITTKGGRVPNPWRNWDEGNLPKALRKVIEDLGYEVL